MRKLWFGAAAVVAGLAGATPAAAQRVWQNNRWVVMPHRTSPALPQANPHRNAHRWNMVNGRWDAGYRAPGGWNGYRRLHRGTRLPHYWTSTGFRIPDYLSFGLAAPPYGYSWSRYYDDAVLVDGDGRVWDSVDGIAWGGAYADADAGDGYAWAEARAGAPYPAPSIQPVGPDDYDVAPYDDHYGPPVAPEGPPPPPPAVSVVPPCVEVCSGTRSYHGGYTYGGGAYYAGGYGGGTTTVIINPAPVVTTTTVVTEEVVTTSYVHSPKRVVRKLRKVRPRCVCR